MSFLKSRLDRLTPVLTPKERAILVMSARHAGDEPDREWLHMPEEQRREYDRYVCLAYTANIQIGALAHINAIRVQHLEWDYDNLERLDRGATILEQDSPEESAASRTRGWRKRPQTVPDFLRAMWMELRDVLQKELKYLWQELRAVEIVWAEIDAEFDGERVADPDRQTEVEETKEKLKNLDQLLAGERRPKKLPEPSEELVAQVRSIVDQAFDALGVLKDL